MFLVMVFVWNLLMYGLMRDRLKSRICEENEGPPFCVPHFKKNERRLIAERNDLKVLGKTALFAFFAAIYFSIQFEAFSGDVPGTYVAVRAYAFVCSIVMGMFWMLLALACARRRSRHSHCETFGTYYWKVPVAIGYCAYLLLDKVAHEHLVHVQSRFLKRND